MLDAYVRDLRSFDRNVRLYLISGALVGFTTAGGIYRWWPTISGATAMATGLSYAVVALAGGYLVPAYGYRAVFALSAVAVVAGALLFQFYFRTDRGEHARGGR